MSYPSGVQLATLTFSNPITVLGNDATKTEISIEPTASVVWSATGQPVDNFEETVSPAAGIPGSLTAPFTDQPGFTDQAGNTFTGWAYVVTRRTHFGGKPKTVRKNWQPVTGQTTTDFDNLPGGSIGLPVSAPVAPVTSVGGFTGAVTPEQIASLVTIPTPPPTLTADPAYPGLYLIGA